MSGYIENIEKLTSENENFRKVLYTAQHSQLVLMSLRPGEEIGEETHHGNQFLRIESGEGKAVLNDKEALLAEGSVVLVPAGVKHNIINASASQPLKLYTLYCPPEHRDGVIHATKAEAESEREHFDGKTTESK